MRNGLGVRYYKTREQVDARVARILTGQVEQLMTVKTATRKGRPTITWTGDHDPIAAAAQTERTNC